MFFRIRTTAIVSEPASGMSKRSTALESERRIQRLATERCHQFHAREASVSRCLLRLPHQRRADAAARMGGMDEKGADSRGIARRVERAVGARSRRPRAAPKSVLRRLQPPQPVIVASSVTTK